MTAITTQSNCLTLINVFTVDPGNQKKLSDLLIQATETVRKQAGFISSSLHSSLDGKKVTMYAQWESISYYNEMRNNPIAAPFLHKAMEISQFELGMYEVVATFTPVL